MGLGSKLKKALKRVGDVFSGGAIGGALSGGIAGGALGGPAGALAGTALGFMSGSSQDAANKANEEAVAAANEANINLWREQAAYNTPANQVARLRAAGLNPNLFYSQGDPGNMSSAPTMKASQYDYNYSQAIADLNMTYQMKNLRAQNENLQAQNRNLNATTANIKAQTEYQRVRSEVEQATLDYYRKFGHFPNEGVVPMISRLLQGNVLLQYSGEALGSSVGDVVGILSSDDLGRQLRGRKTGERSLGSAREFAVKEAQRRGLKGAERQKFIDVVSSLYLESH